MKSGFLLSNIFRKEGRWKRAAWVRDGGQSLSRSPTCLPFPWCITELHSFPCLCPFQFSIHKDISVSFISLYLFYFLFNFFSFRDCLRTCKMNDDHGKILPSDDIGIMTENVDINQLSNAENDENLAPNEILLSDTFENLSVDNTFERLDIAEARETLEGWFESFFKILEQGGSVKAYATESSSAKEEMKTQQGKPDDIISSYVRLFRDVLFASKRSPKTGKKSKNSSPSASKPLDKMEGWEKLRFKLQFFQQIDRVIEGTTPSDVADLISDFLEKQKLLESFSKIMHENLIQAMAFEVLTVLFSILTEGDIEKDERLSSNALALIIVLVENSSPKESFTFLQDYLSKFESDLLNLTTGKHTLIVYQAIMSRLSRKRNLYLVPAIQNLYRFCASDEESSHLKILEFVEAGVSFCDTCTRTLNENDSPDSVNEERKVLIVLVMKFSSILLSTFLPSFVADLTQSSAGDISNMFENASEKIYKDIVSIASQLGYKDAFHINHAYFVQQHQKFKNQAYQKLQENFEENYALLNIKESMWSSLDTFAILFVGICHDMPGFYTPTIIYDPIFSFFLFVPHVVFGLSSSNMNIRASAVYFTDKILRLLKNRSIEDSTFAYFTPFAENRALGNMSVIGVAESLGNVAANSPIPSLRQNAFKVLKKLKEKFALGWPQINLVRNILMATPHVALQSLLISEMKTIAFEYEQEGANDYNDIWDNIYYTGVLRWILPKKVTMEYLDCAISAFNVVLFIIIRDMNRPDCDKKGKKYIQDRVRVIRQHTRASKQLIHRILELAELDMKSIPKEVNDMRTNESDGHLLYCSAVKTMTNGLLIYNLQERILEVSMKYEQMP